MMDLRELRKWHWLKCLHYREKATERTTRAVALNELEQNARAIACFNTIANFHLGCVQALNDVVSGTAEEDCKVQA